VRGVALWLLGASIAFLASAGAFLLLANFGSNQATGDTIPRAKSPEPGSPKPALVLNLPEDRLKGLQREPGQKLVLNVENEGDEELSRVDLALDVASEDTSQSNVRSYQETAKNLAPGEVAPVEFEIDLSPTTPSESREAMPGGANLQENREILEAWATTPEGVWAVKTAVLAP
jgi:hypothetical protein